MDDFGDTGQPVPSHYAVLIYLGVPTGTGTPAHRPQISWIASGDESTCRAGIEQWIATHRLRAGEHAEVLARTSEPRRREAAEHVQIADTRERTADERERIADTRDRIADAREDAADRREAAADERERDLDQRRAELRELVRTIQTESGAAMMRTHELLDEAQARLDRTKAALERSRDQARRALARARFEQAAIDRQIAATHRGSAVAGHAEPTLEATGNSGDDPADHTPRRPIDDN